MPRREDPRRKPAPAWHAKLLAMLPTVIRYAKRAVRTYDPEARQEAVQNVVANTTAAVAGLARRGKLDLAYPTVLAKFGIRQTLDHRKTGSSQNVRDILNKLCQENKGVKVERLDKFNEQEDCWKEAVVQDTRSLPVPEVVAFRVDFKDWLKSLHPRDRKVAQYLSLGNRTADTARRFKVTPSRIAHLRRELAESWRRFVGDEGEGAAAAA